MSRTTSRATPPVARLRRPGEMAAVVPMICGFVPTESLVVVSLRGRRSRVGLTMRLDLPPAGAAQTGEQMAVEQMAVEQLAVEQVVERLRLDGGSGVLLVVYTAAPDDGGELPRRVLAEALTEHCRAAGLALVDALLVREGRWWSYVCDEPGCCPDVGTPLDPEPTRAVGLVAAEQVLDGRAVLPTRNDLVASLAPPTFLAATAARQRLQDTDRARRARIAAEGRVRVGQDALRLWRRTLDRWADAPDDLGPGTAAMLAVSLTDVLVRDEVVTWAVDDDAALLSLLLAVARSCVPPFDAPVCTAVAWTAHARGDGALANVALDRALACDPRYSMAQICRSALDGQVPPSSIRSLLVDSRRALRRSSPWTACHERG